MNTHLRLLPGFVLFGLVSACGGEAPPPAITGPSNDDLVAIRKMDAQYRDAALAKDWAAVTAMFADKAVLMPPGAPLVAGSAAIRDWYVNLPFTIQEFTTNPEAIGGSGNLAINRGSYKLVFTPQGAAAPVTEVGKYIWVMQRQADKSWRVTTGIWNKDQ
jgi:ketosteroid isomerase-like protein